MVKSIVFPDLEMVMGQCRCTYCGLRLSSKKWLLRHYKLVHKKNDKNVPLCDCDENECPTPIWNRLLDVDDECIHMDGTKHKIHRKK